jgi:hypothetical protein
MSAFYRSRPSCFCPRVSSSRDNFAPPAQKISPTAPESALIQLIAVLTICFGSMSFRKTPPP